MKILADGDSRYRLTGDDGREAGWIRGRAVRFLGSASADHVTALAQRAWRAVQAVLRDARDSETSARELRLVRDENYEWIFDEKLLVARLRRPRVGSSNQPSFAIELVVPEKATGRLAIKAVEAIGRAVDGPHGAAPRPEQMSHFIP